MTREQQKDPFIIAYVRAVAAVAGVNTYEPVVDDDSVDIGFAARIVQERVQRPRLEAQLKCSAVIPEINGAFQFPLKIKNYNDPRGDDLVPRILIVVMVPAKPVNWLTQNAEQMIMKKTALWFEEDFGRVGHSPRETGGLAASHPATHHGLLEGPHRPA